MSEETTEHRLNGLEPDNLLAFLALLGLLRALEISRPLWKPRVFWDLNDFPLRPFLTVSHPVTTSEIAAATIEGLNVYSKALWPFSWPRHKSGGYKKTGLFSTISRQRQLSNRCLRVLSDVPRDSEHRTIWELRSELISSSASVKRDSKGNEDIENTPLKLPSGQMPYIGAQFALLKNVKLSHVEESLFSRWLYNFKGSSLRLSPAEERRYAYRANDPSPEGSRTELGASALASLGLLAFTLSESNFSWSMVAYKGTRANGNIFWPILTDSSRKGSSYSSIIAMLRALPLKKIRGAEHISTARRYVLDPDKGDYGNVSRAEVL